MSESCVARAVRTKRWKYCVVAPDRDGVKDPGADRYEEQFLYDLDRDPHERDNLVADPDFQDVRAELAVRLIRRMTQAGESAPLIDPAGGS